METLDLSVPTVHCRSCKLTIEETLEELDGISARVDAPNRARTSRSRFEAVTPPSNPAAILAA